MAEITQTSSGNNWLTTLLLAGGFIFAYQSLNKKNAASTLNFLPGNVYGLSFDGITPVITVGVIVQNTSNQSMTIHSLAGNVYATQYGTKTNVGNVSFFNQQQIFANSQNTLQIQIRLSLIGLVTDIINSINNGVSQTLTFEGYANVEAFQVPLNFTYTV